MGYDKDEISKKFKKGRSLLDSGYYIESIDLFTEIIDITEPLIEEDEDAKVTWNTSLNNRGVAKCKLGYSSGDKSLYESGLDDFRTATSPYSEEHRHRLTAQSNLVYGEKEIKDFDERKGVNFTFENFSE